MNKYYITTLNVKHLGHKLSHAIGFTDDHTDYKYLSTPIKDAKFSISHYDFITEHTDFYVTTNGYEVTMIVYPL